MIKKIMCTSSIVFSLVSMDSAVEPQVWAERVVPNLTCLQPEEMASFVAAYGKYFTSIEHLLSVQDVEGNTLLHNLLLATKNVDLFVFIYNEHASIDIENKDGLSVRELLNLGSYDRFAQAVGIETIPRKLTRTISYKGELLRKRKVVPIEEFKQKRGVPFQKLSLKKH